MRLVACALSWSRREEQSIPTFQGVVSAERAPSSPSQAGQASGSQSQSRAISGPGQASAGVRVTQRPTDPWARSAQQRVSTCVVRMCGACECVCACGACVCVRASEPHGRGHGEASAAVLCSTAGTSVGRTVQAERLRLSSSPTKYTSGSNLAE